MLENQLHPIYSPLLSTKVKNISSSTIATSYKVKCTKDKSLKSEGRDLEISVSEVNIKPTYGVTYVLDKKVLVGLNYNKNPLFDKMSLKEYNKMCGLEVLSKTELASGIESSIDHKQQAFRGKSQNASLLQTVDKRSLSNNSIKHQLHNHNESLNKKELCNITPPKRIRINTRLRRLAAVKMRERKYGKLAPPPLGLSLGHGLFNKP